MIDWGAIIAALVAGLMGGGGIGYLFRTRSENARTDADTDKVAAEGWVMLIQQMSINLTAMQVHITALEAALKERDIQQHTDSKRIEELEKQIAVLTETLAKRDQLITELRAELDVLKTRIMGEKE